MAPRVDPVTSDETLPTRADVVIVGGGIIGVSTALFLAQKGISTVLCEKGHIAGEQSSRNWGWVRKMGRDPRELPLIIESSRLWQGMNERVEAETGFRKTGIFYLCESKQDLAKREAWLAHAKPYQLDSRIVTGEEFDRLLPGSAGRWAGALYTASDGRAEPQRAAPAIARAAQRLGATILTGCAVRGIETAAGRTAAVVTEKGRIACDAVVLAGGAWSSRFCRNLGLRLPQLKVLASVMRTAPVDGGPESAAWGPGFAFRKRLDGGYTVAHGSANVAEIVPDSFRFFFDFLPVLRIEWKDVRLRVGRRFLDEWHLPKRWALDEVSPFERVRVLDPEPAAADIEAAKTNLARAFPVFKNVPIAERWAGLIDATPDTVPVISPVETIPGFFIATGFSGHGFGIGPGAGRLMTDLVTGGPPVVDPSPFRFSRFTDGSRPKPTTGV
jgi:glycine/D-amino acid oxidase-like deaminating enzyme